VPEISRFFGIVIKMFFDDHNPPHFLRNTAATLRCLISATSPSSPAGCRLA